VTSAALPADAKGHVRGLDALRGLAALVVLIRHVVNAVAIPIPVQTALLTSPLAPLLNAQGAVQLFFVLSGYVLALSLARGSGGRGAWVQFWTKRIFRIHPPYVFGVLVALGVSAFYTVAEPGSGVTAWFTRSAAARPDTAEVLASLRSPGKAGGLLPVGWTLEVELIYSFAMPLLVALARPGRGVPLLAVSVALLALDSRFAMLWYAFAFSLGVVAFQQREALGPGLRALPVAARAAVALTGVLLFVAPMLLGWSVRTRGIVVTGFLPREILFMASGSALLVVSAAWLDSWQRVLSRPVLVFLGRISFSVYLLHLTWIHLLAPHLVVRGAPGRSVAILLAAVLAVTVATATVSHRLVELTSIAAGNRVCRWLAVRVGARPLPSHATEA
jgi:peptidoglycan/LPS O-acetylase OafA/YrhL